MRKVCLGFGRVSNLVLVATFLLAGNCAWAGIAACTAAATLGSFGATSSSDGCQASDANFVNFQLGVAGAGVSALTATTGTYVNITTVATSLAPTATYTNNEASDATGAWNDLSNHGSEQVFEDVNAVNNGAPTPPANEATYIHTITLTGAATITTLNDALTVTQDICQGNVVTCDSGSANVIILAETLTDTASGVTGAWTCTASNIGGCSLTSSTSAITVTLVSFQNALTIDTTISSTHNNPLLTNFEDAFTEDQMTPEPSTFLLLGAGLIGVAAFQLRRRKQQS